MPTNQGSGSDNSSGGNWWNFLGSGVGDLANYLGNRTATNDLLEGNAQAQGTQQGVQNQILGLYGNQRALGVGADTALGNQLGLYGAPNYSAFMNSPGFQGSLALGNQAIERAASANGSLYTPNMLNALGQYDTTYASQNYNNYINSLLASAGLGQQANAGSASGLLNTGNNISQIQQNAGQNRAGGAATNSGIASNLLGKVPWSQVGNSISNWWNTPSTDPSGSGQGGFGGDWYGNQGDVNSVLDQYGADSAGSGSTDLGNYWDSGTP